MHLSRAGGALCLLALMAPLLGGCGASQSKAPGLSTKKSHHRHVAAKGHTPPALDIVGRTHGSYLGTVAAGVQWSLQAVSMATPTEGWAVARDKSGETIAALQTLDGGQSFSQRYAAKDPIVSMATPTAADAYLLENSCFGPGCGTSVLTGTTDGGQTFHTVWQKGGFSASAVSFPDAMHGFIVGTVLPGTGPPPTSGEIFSTSDGGANWSSMPIPCAGQYPTGMALDFSSPEHGWLLCGGEGGVGNQGKSLLQTSDGGRHWTKVASTGPGWTSGSLPISGYVDSVFIASPMTGYIGLQRGGFLVTHDGGKTWAEAYGALVPPGSDQGYQIGFLPSGFGWLFGGEAAALYTSTNGKDTFSQVYPSLIATGDVALLPGGAAFAVSTFGSQPSLLESGDAGGTWTAIAELGSPNSGISALQVLEGGTFVQAYQHVIATTQDFGAHWQDTSLPSGWQPVGLGFAGPGLGFVVGKNTSSGAGNALFSCAGITCRKLRTPFTPAAALAVGANGGFAVGTDDSGRYGLFQTSDGGLNWTENLLPSGFGPIGVGENRHLTWIYAQSAFLWSYTGTSAWHEVLLGANETVTSLSLQGYEDALMTTSSAKGLAVWRSTDGGQIFRAVP